MSMPSDRFQAKFKKGIPNLRRQLMRNFRKFKNRGGYKIVWEEFEDKIFDTVRIFLLDSFPGLRKNDIIQTETKSSYPDFKVSYNGKLYAIDIKSGAAEKTEPWYDMGRLDTFERGHTKKYAAEFYITVKYRRVPDHAKAIEVEDIYIEPAYHSVGFNHDCRCVLYRLYDGKIRPKSWAEFSRGKTYWKTLDTFLIGLARSRSHRRMTLIQGWIKEMSVREKSKIRGWLTD